MKPKNSEPEAIVRTRQPGAAATCIGRINGMDQGGRILVSYGGGRCNPARLVAGLNRFELATSAYKNREVLLNFAEDDPDQPIVVALLADPVEELICLSPEQARPEELKVDGQTLVIQADREIVLKCGQSSLLLRRDGKIVLKGVEIVSRARKSNKIKGAYVEVN